LSALNIIVVIIILGGWISGRVFARIGLPTVLGMLFCGVCISLFGEDVVPAELHSLAPFLRSAALITILLRAGLSISKQSLAQVRTSAVLMSFIPCLLEGVALTLAVRWLFELPWSSAGLAAFMLAAVSPAVVVPSMLELKQQGYGNNNSVTTLVLAGASLDDVLAITVFALFLQVAGGSSINAAWGIASMPLAIIGGIALGALAGAALAWYFRNHRQATRASEKTLLLLMVALLLVEIGNWLHAAALLAVMTVGIVLLEYAETAAHELAAKLAKLWIPAEIILFVLIGMAVDLQMIASAGIRGLAAIGIGLSMRAVGVWLATIPSSLNRRERWFCVIAYLPKATVQAALGGVALAHGIAGGQTILALAVMAIATTAPLGLFAIRRLGPRLLKIEQLSAAAEPA